MTSLRGKNEGHVQRTSGFVLKDIMVYWEKQEHRIVLSIKK